MIAIDQPTLTALIDRLIPADDAWPSASDNGVPDYLARQLGGDLSNYKPWLAIGLQLLVDEASARHRRGFAALGAAEQDRLLHDLEAGKTRIAWSIAPSEFLARLTEWCAEGYYADPEHNHGNPNKTSWEMIGFDERR